MLILDKNLIFDISCWALNGKFLENFLLLIINYRHLNIPTNVMKIRHILYFSCWFFMNRLLIIDKFDENWSRIGQFFSYLMLIFDENLIFLVWGWALNGQFQLSMKIRAKLVHFFSYFTLIFDENLMLFCQKSWKIGDNVFTFHFFNFDFINFSFFDWFFYENSMFLSEKLENWWQYFHISFFSILIS